MSITFRCPGCRHYCAVNEEYAGRAGQCEQCKVRFVIPEFDGEEASIIEDVEGDPMEGFYEAVLQSWRIFTQRGNVIGLTIIAAMVVARFLLGHLDFSFTMPGFRLQLPVGMIAVVITTGSLCWYYFEVVASSALECYIMPEGMASDGFGFLWRVVKSIYLFFIAILLALFPAILLVNVLSAVKIELPSFVKHGLMILSLGLFPMIILTLSAGRGMWMVFGPKYIFRPILKAPKPYLVLVAMTGVAGLFEWYTFSSGVMYDKSNPWISGAMLVGNLAAVALTILAMRIIGLFCVYYACYLPQLVDSEDY